MVVAALPVWLLLLPATLPRARAIALPGLDGLHELVQPPLLQAKPDDPAVTAARVLQDFKSITVDKVKRIVEKARENKVSFWRRVIENMKVAKERLNAVLAKLIGMKDVVDPAAIEEAARLYFDSHT
mmetsp:Transcript_91846/g.213546  ORF Transcript_91846/g.213546 Transcript_91846/m.213546 type:complete len:127 (-) Transcript_91846:87-467(-)